jgi:hypothetical protein
LDLVLEDRSGQVAGIEVKASGTVRADDLRGLCRLAERTANRWHLGVVLYLGHQGIPFSARLHALPVTALWETPGGSTAEASRGESGIRD